MGRLDYIVHGGRRFQSYLMCDYNERKVGDVLPWVPDFGSPGSHIDGLHEAYAEDTPTDVLERWLVVVKDKTIRVLVKDGDNEESQNALRDHLRREYDFQPPPRSLWPELAWEAKQWREDTARSEREARLKEREAAWARMEDPANEPQNKYEQLARFYMEMAKAPEKAPAELPNLFSKEAFLAADAINDFTRMKMREPGFFRQLMGRKRRREDLIEFLLPKIQAEFDPLLHWSYGEAMLRDAMHYRMERLLKEAGLWDEGKDRSAILYLSGGPSDASDFHVAIDVNQLCDPFEFDPAIPGQTVPQDGSPVKCEC